MSIFYSGVLNREGTINNLVDFNVYDDGIILSLYATKLTLNLKQLTAYGFAKLGGYAGTLDLFISDCNDAQQNSLTCINYWNTIINHIDLSKMPVSYAVIQNLNLLQKSTARTNVNAVLKTLISLDYIKEITKEVE